MTHQSLREVCKFLAGMVAGKIMFILWLTTAGFAPLILAGTPFTIESIFPSLIFNIAIFIVLIYYGWHIKSPVHAPTEHTLLLIAGFVFLLVAVIHFLRLELGWDLIVGDLGIPLWLSWAGLVLALYLSYASFHFALRTKRH